MKQGFDIILAQPELISNYVFLMDSNKTPLNPVHPAYIAILNHL
jgi:hypothetical protein